MTNPTPERIAAALALAEAVDAYDTKATAETAKAHQVTLAAYRATAPKPRFNPARISQETRERAFRLILDGVQSDSVEWADMRTRILDESREPPDPQQPYGSSSVDSAVPPPAPAAGATFSHQNPVQNPRCLTCNAGMVYRHTLTDSGWYCFPCAVKRPAPPMPSGPRPTPATKESSDTAGVEAGAANRITDHDADQREVEACSCEESEALKDELKECRQLLDYARRCAQDIVTVLEEARK